MSAAPTTKDDVPRSGLFDLTGRVALVTGGSRGIGFAIARGLAAAGAQVTIVDRDKAVSAAAMTLVDEGFEVYGVEADVTDEDGIARMLEDLERRHGRLDILVNNAAILLSKSAAETDRETWRRIIETNLTACFFMAQAAARLMPRASGGAIINMSSIVGQVARRKLSAYIAAKAGIDGLTRSLAGEFSGQGITVNAIAPGFITTEMSRTGSKAFDDFVVGAVPIGRWGTPEDIAGVAVFLASKAASYVNGQTIYVDGGFTAYSQ